MIIGLDMGGTHIDAVIIKENRVVHTVKRPTNREDLFNSIWGTLKELLKDYDKTSIKRINLSTTISTNAIVEKKNAPVGLIIQPGPGINHDFLACGDVNEFVKGYVDHRGVVVSNKDDSEIDKAILNFKAQGIKSCAVISKFSTRNPNHELEIEKQMGNDFDVITLGHRMSGELNFPRRVFTSYLNSAVFQTFNAFSKNIKMSLEKEGIDTNLYILKADGGTMTIDQAINKPVETILSGPAASFMGISSMVTTSSDAILLDIGGTTTDIFFLSDGEPLFEPLGAKIANYKTLVRAIYSHSIGLGGDSEIIIKDKKIFIGPTRAGKPYAFGGPIPTPTDAMIYLGLMVIPKGASLSKAKEAMNILSKELSLSLEETAYLILNTMANTIKQTTDDLLIEINSKPIYTINELLYGKKVMPKGIHMIGGPAEVLKTFIERAYNLDIHVPNDFAVANAIGAALSKPTLELTLLANTALGTLVVSELGIYESVSKDFTMKKAIERITSLLKDLTTQKLNDEDIEITEESSFNMVRGFQTSGKNIRVKAQIKPGYITTLVGEKDEG